MDAQLVENRNFADRLLCNRDHKLLRSIMLVLLGLITVLALPPVHIWPAAFVGLSGLFLFLEKADSKRAVFLRGWLFGIGFFGGGLYWLTNAFLVNADKHGWLIPIAVPALAAVMGLYIAFTALLARFLWRGQNRSEGRYGRIILFALAWTVMEWVRGWLFTGFAWNLMGTIWAFNDEMIQPAAWFGAYGLSLLTVLSATLLAPLYYFKGKKRFLALVPAILILLSFYISGSLRLANVDVTYHDGILLRLVQPNIEQKTKWKRSHQAQHFQTLLKLATDPSDTEKRPTHIIWPETAVTAPLANNTRLQRTIGSIAPTGGAILTGVPRITPKGQKPFQIWNNMVAINELGDVLDSFDKFHLVPFGEYVPMRTILPIGKITIGAVDFTPGPGPRTLHTPGLPSYSPLICYEVIFPDHVIDPNDRPQWLLNITNDGWYGDSPGPYQHLASARMRAVEEGIPLVRVANTGVSVITDPYGRIETKIPYGIEGIRDVPLAKATDKPTLAAQGRTIIWGSLALLFLIVGQVMLSYGNRSAKLP